MKFEEAVSTCRSELWEILARWFPLDAERAKDWSTPGTLTELSLGLDQWPFLDARCGELRRTSASRFSIGPLASTLGIKADPRLSEPQLVDADLEIDDEDDEQASALRDAQRTLTLIVYGILLADVSARRAELRTTPAADIRFFVYQDLDDPTWSPHVFWVADEERPFFARYVQSACAHPSVAAFVLDVVASDVGDQQDAASWMAQKLDAHPAVRELFAPI